MSFYRKYELDRLIADGDAKTFRAVENSTGRVVFLHLFNPSGQTLLAVLRAKLGGAAGKPLPPLIEVGEFAGSQYAVTQAIEPFHNLRDWIVANVTASNPLLDESSSPALSVVPEASLPKPSAATPSGPLVIDYATPARAPAAPVPLTKAPITPPPVGGLLSDGPGEFARGFTPPAPTRPRNVPPTPPASGGFTRGFDPPSSTRPRNVPPTLPASGGFPSDGPGEFTRGFDPPAPRNVSPAPPPSGGFPSDGPGEFTRGFDPPAPRNVPPTLPASGGFPSDGPGEFTRGFDPPAPRSVPPAPPPSGGFPSDGPGQFARGFAPPAPTPVPPDRVPPAPPGDFTRLFENPDSEPPALAPPRASLPPGPRASAPAAPPAREPGEFTRMFDPPAGNSPALPAPSATPSKGNPGEFTRLFQVSSPPQARLREANDLNLLKDAPPPAPGKPPAAAPPGPPPARPPKPLASRPGNLPDDSQFEGLFGSRIPGESIDIEKEHASAARSAPPENRPFQAAGEFTRMFGPQGVGGTPAKDVRTPSLNADGRTASASGLFGDPGDLAKAGKDAPSEPGEYTRMFDNPKKPAEPPKAPAPVVAVPEAAPPRKSNRDFVILGVIAGLVLVVLIVGAVFLFRH